ncbi:MAG: glycoside hydrolase family 125 protein [Candidatus Eremiobacteraeota bacterium]|nr:glycoside hydrolase family 125 protein [Candidatus Eremiobacteraeota bacterium]
MWHRAVAGTLAVIVFATIAQPARATHRMSLAPQFQAPRFLRVPLTGGRAEAITTSSLFHTIFNDFRVEPDGTTYVQTGDIPAMWLRDSSAQTIPYVRFQPIYPKLRTRFAGVIERDARNILVDPYANAFLPTYGVWENKWEVDSLSFFVLMTWVYWSETGDHTIFTRSVHDALRKIVQTYSCEQDHQRCSHYSYPVHVPTEFNYAGGTGMIWCAFRPSDDAVAYRFNIPQEMFATVALRALVALAMQGYGDLGLAVDAQGITDQVDAGIRAFGRYYDFRHGWMYVYETNGEGRRLLIDDANLPNLLSIPYYGYSNNLDPTYQRTRGFVLSPADPYYHTGRYASGLGSEHTPAGWVWPLGIVTRALTAQKWPETSESVTILAETDSEDGLIHESFYPNAYWKFTRAEFGWANALYAELIFRSVADFDDTTFGPAPPFLDLEPPSLTPRLTTPEVQLEDALRLIEVLGTLLHQLG